MEDAKTPPNIADLKSKGNDCVKEEKFAEAILLYTQAIKLDPKNYVLYSNRSLAFLRLDQHFLALQDANETIRLEPQWPKGYFRRAEVEAASELYEEAMVSYGRALQLQPHDAAIIDAIKRVTMLRRAKITCVSVWLQGYFRRAEVEAASELYEEAMVSYGRALQLQPHDAAIIEAIKRVTMLRSAKITCVSVWLQGYFRRAEVEAASELYEEAMVSYGRALQLQPHDAAIIDAIKRVTMLRRAKITCVSVWLQGYFRRAEVEAASELYEEAMVSYGRALQLQPHDAAIIDAIKRVTMLRRAKITCVSVWLQGYFRRAEVEAASELYEEAMVSYGRALQLQPHDAAIIDAIKRVTMLRRAKITSNQNIIWLSTCIGLIVGISIVVSDYAFTDRPSLTNPIVMVLFALIISGAGYGVGKVITMSRNWSAGQSLTPPEGLDLFGNNETEPGPDTKRTKYSKAQARQRYKQGKL